MRFFVDKVVTLKYFPMPLFILPQGISEMLLNEKASIQEAA